MIYMKGISGEKLQPIIDFIYNGEALVTQEELEVFIETGKKLQLKGIEDDLTGIVENLVGSPMNHSSFVSIVMII